MSDIFKGYEEEYCALSASIGQKTAKVEGLGEAERRPVMKEVEAELTQASELLEQMALEVRSLPAAERSRLNTTLKGYKARNGAKDKYHKNFLAVVERLAAGKFVAWGGCVVD